MNRPFLSVAALLLSALCATASEPPAAAGPPLSLREAVERTLKDNPGLKARKLEVASAKAHATQSSARPNPTLDIAVENAPGTGRLGAGSGAETTLQLSQVFEWPGKRRARVGFAESLRAKKEAEERVAIADAAAAVCDQFAHVIGDQHRLALATEDRRAAEAVLETTRQRLASGAAPELEERRARIAVARARIAEEHAEHELAVSRKLLASHWGARRADFGPLSGDLFLRPELPPFEELARQLNQSPSVMEWASERAVRVANLRLVESRARPDITLGAGGRRLEEAGEFAALFRLSIPLPIFDRMEGAKREASLQLDKVEQEREQAELHLEATLYDLHEELGHHRTELEVIDGEILPDSVEALNLAREAYLAGRIPQLEMLDAQRTLIEIRKERVMAGEMFHRLLVHIERLLGAPKAHFSTGNP